MKFKQQRLLSRIRSFLSLLFTVFEFMLLSPLATSMTRHTGGHGVVAGPVSPGAEAKRPGELAIFRILMTT